MRAILRFFKSLFSRKKKPPVVVVPDVVADVLPEIRWKLHINAHNLNDATLAKLAALHIEKVRYTVYWNRWLTEPGYREIVAKDVNCGLEVLAVLSGQGDLPDLSGFVEMVKDVHALNPANPLQIWNEADHVDGPGNGWSFFGGDPDLYCAHFEEVRRAVPSAFLVSTGLADGGDVLVRWVKALNRSSADAIALHSYGPPPLPNYKGKAELTRLHTHKRLYNTEFGSPQWADQRKDIEECARLDGLYQHSYVFCLNTGHDHEYVLTAESEAWLREWNGRT